jgi:hypothetical protein
MKSRLAASLNGVAKSFGYQFRAFFLSQVIISAAAQNEQNLSIEPASAASNVSLVSSNR